MSKFKYIQSFMDCKPQAFVIPTSTFLSKNNYQEMGKTLSFETDLPFILRSELKGEGGEALRSGESISVRDICTKDEFGLAWEKVIAQDGLARALLQDQVDCEAHITGICYHNHVFLEIKIKDNIYFSFISNGFRVGYELSWELLEEAIREFQDKEYMVFELGLSQGEKAVLYQLMEIDEGICLEILENGYFKEIFKNIRKFDKPLKFYQMMKFIIKSRIARIKSLEEVKFHPIKNWNYIMFYFTLYRYLQKKDSNIKTFEDFFTWSRSNKSWVASCALEHIKLANKFTTSSDVKAELSTQKTIFIGKGVLTSNIVFF